MNTSGNRLLVLYFRIPRIPNISSAACIGGQRFGDLDLKITTAADIYFGMVCIAGNTKVCPATGINFKVFDRKIQLKQGTTATVDFEPIALDHVFTL